MQNFSIAIPLKLVSPNVRQHWAQSSKISKDQKRMVLLYLQRENVPEKKPKVVKLTRFSPREFDYDNLVASFKAVRDAVAHHLTGKTLKAGQADNGMRFEYFQQKRKDVGILCKIEFD